MFRNYQAIAAVALLLCSGASSGSQIVQVEHYGMLPYVRSVSISPDGELITYIQRGEDGDYFVIAERETGKVVGGGDARRIKARSIEFATNRHVILFVSETDRWGAKYRWERTGSYLYDIESRNLRELPGKGDLTFAPGHIVGIDRDREVVYMPAYIGRQSPKLSLFEVSLKTTRAVIHAYGSVHTVDWFVDSDGRVAAREDYHSEKKTQQIYVRIDDEWKLIFEAAADTPKLIFDALSQDGQYLLFMKDHQGVSGVFRLSLDDGSKEGPLYGDDSHGAERLLTRGMGREFIGVRFSGLRPGFWYRNPEMQAHQVAMEATFPNSSVERLSATGDLSTIVFRVSGNEAAQDYLLFDTRVRSLAKLESAYPRVPADQIGPIEAIRYTARDGTPVTAIVTWPPGITNRTGLPMIVLPHGGPESYDSVGFDWWAQYFARSGYVILQPNFRGSSGFGTAFRDAGYGGWGTGVMQHDVTDGVQRMIDAGHVDSDRICIMGASYGGYAALAGGAFTPELYRCVISVNGVSDLHRMLRKTKFLAGSDSWAVRYWRKSIDDTEEGAQKLKNLSPARYAESFEAPVLLLHGKDDSVVPWEQSLFMSNALRDADKHVELITIKGEDHWLSSSATRMEMLREISRFVREHNPPNEPLSQ